MLTFPPTDYCPWVAPEVIDGAQGDPAHLVCLARVAIARHRLEMTCQERHLLSDEAAAEVYERRRRVLEDEMATLGDFLTSQAG